MNLDALEAALSMDRALSLGQAARFGLPTGPRSTAELERVGLPIAARQIAETSQGRCPLWVGFVCRDPATARLEGWRLRHLAGLAAVRHRLGAPPQAWALLALAPERDAAGRWSSRLVPDALWRSPQGEVAVEFDAGSHTRAVLREKALAYSSRPQVWAAATEARASTLRGVLAEVLPQPGAWRVLTVGWLGAKPLGAPPPLRASSGMKRPG